MDLKVISKKNDKPIAPVMGLGHALDF